MEILKNDTKPKMNYLSDMSASHILRYRNLYGYNTQAYSNKREQEKKMEKIFVEYSLMYFETALTIIIASFLLNLHVSMLDDYEDYKETSPADYAVLLHGVSPPPGEYVMQNQISLIVNQVSAYTGIPMVIYQIIPCLKILDIYKKCEKKYKLETKLYHAYNFEPQIKLNKEKGNSRAAGNLRYYDILALKNTPVSEIQQKINELQIEINQLEENLINNPNKYNGGTYFVIFETIKMRDEFYRFFPHSYGEKIINFFKYYLCCCCLDNKSKAMSDLMVGIDVGKATEPYDVEWE